MRRAICLAVVAVVTGLVGAATAQPLDARGPVLRVEPDTRTEFSRPGFVTGWVYNDGQGVAGLVRMKVEMLDDAGARVAEHIGWAYGNVTPGGRAYFMIPIPPRSPANRRVIVESFVLQSLEAPSQSP
ncbi:MAG: hypothetical protein FJZ38_10045 [Candidatus Rokubacteria bacterium]|nr:hypothetical protein [Candidatus Rokubacteria bacterium]